MQQLQHNKYKIAHNCNKKCYFNKIPKKNSRENLTVPPTAIIKDFY